MKHSKYKKSMGKRPGGKRLGTFEELDTIPFSSRESEVGVRGGEQGPAQEKACVT